MKKLLIAATIAVMAAMVPVSAMAEGLLPVSIGTDHTYNNKYIWRGLNATDDPVYQGDVWTSYKGFTLNVWWNVDLTDINGEKGNFTEVDYNIDYSWDYDDFSFSAGGIMYDFPQFANTETFEVYAGVGYDMIAQPSLTLYYDMDDADGFYALMSVGHSFDLMDNELYSVDADMISASLDLSASAGWASENWNDFYYGAAHSTFVDVVAGASLPIGITDYVTVTPSAAYSTVVDGALRTKSANDHEWILGITLSAEI